MAASYIPWWICAVWLSLTLLSVLTVTMSSVRSWVPVTEDRG